MVVSLLQGASISNIRIMKKIICLLYFFTCITLICNAQEIELLKKNKKKYISAYKYLLNLDTLNSIKNNLIISDTIVYLEISNFHDVFYVVPQNKKENIFLLDSLDNIRKHNAYHSNLSFLKKKPNRRYKYILFFSREQDNYLIAELVKISRQKNKSYLRNTIFGSSLLFLFVFDDNNDIKEFYQKVLQYN